MKLHDLKPNEGKKQTTKRVGRGQGSGVGKTAGRGTKGEGARSGGGNRLYHQGGNLPFFRRLPFKRGFTPIDSVEYNEINLDELGKFEAGAEVSPETLLAARMLRQPEDPVVILGRGEIDRPLKVIAHRVSNGARAKIEAAGGSVAILGE